MGQEVSEAVSAPKEFGETILKCLKRDPDWVAYHASELTEAAHVPPVDQLALRVAATERRAFRLQRLGQYEKALAELETLMADEALTADAQRRAWLASSAARIAYQAGDANKGQKLQTTAFSINNNHSPPRIRPPPRGPPRPGQAGARDRQAPARVSSLTSRRP